VQYVEELNYGIESKAKFYVQVGTLHYRLENPSFNESTGLLSGDLVKLVDGKSKDLSIELKIESYDIIERNTVRIQSSKIEKLKIWEQ